MSSDEQSTGPVVVDPAEFFPGSMDDLSKVTWAHGVNSVAQLKDALQDDTIMMVEADISAGELKEHASDDSGDDKNVLPGVSVIMAHPPHKTSDLSLAAWIEGIIKANKDGKKKGAKLDFKDQDVVKESLKMLAAQRDKITFPLWLNADILKGSVDSTATPLDPQEFLDLCVQYFPQATLSVGWTTRFTTSDEVRAEYNKAMVEDMMAALTSSNVSQPVTFPVRASFVPRSIEALELLLDNVADSTLTLWSPKDEPIDPVAILSLQDSVGIDSLYMDLPTAQRKAVDEARVRQQKEQKASSGVFRLFPAGATAAVASAGLALASALAALYLYE